MRKAILTRPTADMTGNPADEPISREDFPFPDYLKKLGCKEEDYIIYRLENGALGWKPTVDRRKKIAAELKDIFKNAPKSEFDDMIDDEVMEIANREKHAMRADKEKELARKKP